VTYGSGERTRENGDHERQESPSETVYSAAGKTAVPGLSQLREKLESAVAAEDWARVAELAQALLGG